MAVARWFVVSVWGAEWEVAVSDWAEDGKLEMPIFDINDIAKVGSVADVRPYMLPPEVWTTALNMRYEDEALKTLEGWAQIFGTPTTAPHFGMLIARPETLISIGSAASILVYVSLTNARWYDGTNHTDATRTVGGSYTATHTRQWNGTIAGGGIAILNNGVDVPQFSSTPGIGTLENLTNWPSTLRAAVVRAFGPHLVALHIVDDGVRFPHRVRWSHPASPGSLPSSWDITDTTKDAGQFDLPDAASGLLLDGLPLGSIMYLYKETSVWRMRYVGGQSKFDFSQGPWIHNEGLLGMGSVCITGDGTKHVFATTSGDVLWHNGNQVQSILTQRQRRRLQNDIDAEFARASFMFANPFTHSVWFCYPSQGQTQPNRALHMCYKAIGGNDWSVTEVDGITFRNAIVGNMPTLQGVDVWDLNDGVVWDDDAVIWDTASASGSSPRRRLILLDPANTKFYANGTSALRDGASFTSSLRRDGLGVLGKKRNGEPIVDFQRKKMITRVWPKITGGSVNVRFNSQQEVDGPISTGAAVVYNPATDMFADPQTMEGRAVGLEFSATEPWQIEGYKINIEPLGEF